MPLISIILPVYNGQEFLKYTIESVVNQKFQDWELILVNDGSTDSTQQIAENYAKQDSRIKIISQENLGLSSARNTGLANCEGEIIGFLDADDKYLPDCLAIISNHFMSLKIDLVISGYFYFIDTFILHTHSFHHKQISPNSLIQKNLAPPVAHFIRRELAMQIGSFDISLKSCEDWDFWIRASRMGTKIYTIPEVLVGYQYVPNSMSRNAHQMYIALSEVSRRAFKKDNRLPKNASFNKDVSIDLAPIQKQHLIHCLGILIHQGKAEEASRWFLEEKEIWNWEVSSSDWLGLSSALSWRYFLDHNYIEEVFMNVKPSLSTFFLALGYEELEATNIILNIMKPQRFRMNHYRYGKLLGALINRVKG